MCSRVQGKEPDIVVVNKNKRSCATTDITIPGDIRVSEKEKGNLRDTRNLREKSKGCGTSETLRSF